MTHLNARYQLRPTFFWAFAMLVMAALLYPVHAQADPTLVSDKADYAPGEVAVLTGTGFQPGEPIDLSIAIDDPETGTHIGDYDWMNFNAGPDGGFVESYTVPPEAEGMTLVATAMGLQSSLVAKATFTDSNIGVHNVRFNTSGLPNGTAITISGNTPNPGTASHAPTAYSQSFTTPATSSNVGATVSNVTADPPGPVTTHTHGDFSFTFAGFPTSVPGVGGNYNLTDISVTAGSAPVTNFTADVSTGSGSFTTGAANTGAGGVPTTVSGAYTFVPTPINNPPVIACLDPTANLSNIVGLLNGGFNATVPISYAWVPAEGKVKATFITPSSNVSVDVAMVTDPESDTLTVVPTGPSSVTLEGPGTVNALLSALAAPVHITANDGINPTVTNDCDVTVNAKVVYNFVGFGSPLSNTVTRIVKRGATVPTKFRLYDAAGVEICTDLAAGPYMIDVLYHSGTAPNGEAEVTDSGSSNDNGDSFRYSGTCGVDGTWIFNLKTNTTYQLGNTYKICAALNDDTTHDALISIK